ncbi:unnamed protein product [Phaeothamnion confervicola]
MADQHPSNRVICHLFGSFSEPRPGEHLLKGEWAEEKAILEPSDDKHRNAGKKYSFSAKSKGQPTDPFPRNGEYTGAFRFVGELQLPTSISDCMTLAFTAQNGENGGGGFVVSGRGWNELESVLHYDISGTCSPGGEAVRLTKRHTAASDARNAADEEAEENRHRKAAVAAAAAAAAAAAKAARFGDTGVEVGTAAMDEEGEGALQQLAREAAAMTASTTWVDATDGSSGGGGGGRRAGDGDAAVARSDASGDETQSEEGDGSDDDYEDSNADSGNGYATGSTSSGDGGGGSGGGDGLFDENYGGTAPVAAAVYGGISETARSSVPRSLPGSMNVTAAADTAAVWSAGAPPSASGGTTAAPAAAAAIGARLAAAGLAGTRAMAGPGSDYGAGGVDTGTADPEQPLTWTIKPRSGAAAAADMGPAAAAAATGATATGDVVAAAGAAATCPPMTAAAFAATAAATRAVTACNVMAAAQASPGISCGSSARLPEPVVRELRGPSRVGARAYSTETKTTAFPPTPVYVAAATFDSVSALQPEASPEPRFDTPPSPLSFSRPPSASAMACAGAGAATATPAPWDGAGGGAGSSSPGNDGKCSGEKGGRRGGSARDDSGRRGELDSDGRCDSGGSRGKGDGDGDGSGSGGTSTGASKGHISAIAAAAAAYWEDPDRPSAPTALRTALDKELRDFDAKSGAALERLAAENDAERKRKQAENDTTVQRLIAKNAAALRQLAGRQAAELKGLQAQQAAARKKLQAARAGFLLAIARESGDGPDAGVIITDAIDADGGGGGGGGFAGAGAAGAARGTGIDGAALRLGGDGGAGIAAAGADTSSARTRATEWTGEQRWMKSTSSATLAQTAAGSDAVAAGAATAAKATSISKRARPASAMAAAPGTVKRPRIDAPEASGNGAPSG